TRVVSNSFNMGEWEADETATAPDGCSSYCRAYLWIVPAKVQGTWKIDGGELKLGQTFQMLSGTMKAGGSTTAISGGRMTGDEISFTAGGSRYTGRVNGNSIEGTIVSGSRRTTWTATR
ncbi:MAG: SAM-dependent methyltransferase, partial [Betaproteobacteria bacterium]|nr:SAM-dependent methyltransferase [Betaproteobacteria bacterium]